MTFLQLWLSEMAVIHQIEVWLASYHHPAKKHPWAVVSPETGLSCWPCFFGTLTIRCVFLLNNLVWKVHNVGSYNQHKRLLGAKPVRSWLCFRFWKETILLGDFRNSTIIAHMSVFKTCHSLIPHFHSPKTHHPQFQETTFKIPVPFRQGTMEK